MGSEGYYNECWKRIQERSIQRCIRKWLCSLGSRVSRVFLELLWNSSQLFALHSAPRLIHSPLSSLLLPHQ